jgi:hypothetical protein
MSCPIRLPINRSLPMPSTRETILAALTAQLAARAGAEVRRNATLPERVPAEGLMICATATRASRT